MPSLIVTSGALAGQVFSFGETAVVGRGQFTEVRLNHPTVSRRHALLRETPDGFELSDQDSANGTRHRGQRITAPVRIADGDEIEFGEVKTLFRGERAENVSSPGLGLEEHTTGTHATIDPQRLAAALGNEAPGLRDLLARLKLFCDLGAIARREAALREQLDQALDALLAAFPRAQRAAVIRISSAADVLPTVAERARSNAPAPFAQRDAFLKEALRLQNGINIVEPVSRTALAARLHADAPPHCLIALPLRRGADVLGLLYVEGGENAWRVADHELLYGVAGTLALLLNSQAISSERAIEAHDLALARRIQQRFLPQSPPDLPGYRIADSYAAARVIGGDHYDFFAYKDGRVGIAIADVSGKSVSGALYMARLSVQLRTLAKHLSSPVELLTGLNRKLYQELEAGMFVTMLAAALDVETGAIEFACAGHPSPLLRAPDGKVSELSETGALPLGAMADTQFRSYTTTIERGSCLLLYTDGLDEAHDAQQQLFGKERIVNILRDSNGAASDVLDTLLAEVARFSAGEPQNDDLTLIALSRDR